MLYLIKTAKFHGNRIALHENYVDMYPDSDLYDESALAGTPSGDFKKAWYNRETGVRALQSLSLILSSPSLHPLPWYSILVSSS